MVATQNVTAPKVRTSTPVSGCWSGSLLFREEVLQDIWLELIYLGREKLLFQHLPKLEIEKNPLQTLTQMKTRNSPVTLTLAAAYSKKFFLDSNELLVDTNGKLFRITATVLSCHRPLRKHWQHHHHLHFHHHHLKGHHP